jgi:PAS domain S-box-containing protein
MPRKKTRTAKPRAKNRAKISPPLVDWFHKYEQVLASFQEMIAVVDRNFRYVLANRAFLDYRGARREQIVGHPVSDVSDPHTFGSVLRPKLQECFKDHSIKFVVMCTYPSGAGGNPFVSYYPISGPAGLVQVASLLQDISERKRALAAVREERDRAQSYLDIADVILLALDLQGRVTLINRKGCSTLGWEESELLGRKWIETCLPAATREQIRVCFHNVLAGDQSYIQNPVLTKEGEERMIGWRNSLLRDSAGAVIGTLSSGEDITERLKFESTLRHLSGRLLQAQDEERRKVAREVHDGIGTYVSGLSLALGKIRTFLDDANPEHQRAIAECREMIQAASGEIRSISYLLHPPMIEVMGLESALEWLVRGFSSRSGIGISLQLAPDLGRLRPELEMTLFRVTQEALSNVHRHSGSSTAALRMFRENDQIVLEVADQGRGMPPHSVGAAPEFTVGISGMRERVEDLGGTFSIESAPGEGCIVRAALPLTNKP